jgi:single-stranded DNA-binding protein
MNSLNSILIEGTLLSNPISNSENEVANCVFRIANYRYPEIEGVKTEIISNLTIKATHKIAEDCLANLKKGNGVRVVGRLKTEIETIKVSDNPEEDITYEKVFIYAEHIEIKPVFPVFKNGSHNG